MKEIQDYIKGTLKNLYAAEETESLMRIILEHVCGKPYPRILIDGARSFAPQQQEQIHRIVDRLLLAEPIQYVLGEAFFYNHIFRVNKHTLIPRPETEELVGLILSDYAAKKECRILDVGTGSGCIALSLAKYLPEAQVVALDVSAGALEVARENARLLDVGNVSFVQADILAAHDWPTLLGGAFDCIVSNPPYILMEEQAAMDRNVLDYEPADALFVPDDDPLLFYRTIAALGRELIRPAGGLYFEINARYGPELVALLKQMNYQGIELIRDLSGKDRIIKTKR